MAIQAFRYLFPQEVGGGDFVMRKSKGGEVEDGLKASIPTTADQAAAAQLDSQCNLICDALHKFRGEDVPKRGKERLAWWYGLNADERDFLIGIHDRLNTVKAVVIDDFFARGEAMSL